MSATQQPPHLERALSSRHIQLIAIGGAIGTGLFMGAGKTIAVAGPSVIFVYMIIGFMLFFVMRAMGELLLAPNLPTVRAFGKTGFWFALIKIVAILALIVVGLVMIVTGFETDGSRAAFSNLWAHEGMFPTGSMGFVAGFQIAVFAFVGIELVGTTAAEAKDPEVTLPRAVDSIPVRILIFYVGSLIVRMAVRPWTTYSGGESPFMGMFAVAGLVGAAGVVNFVVLTSATSSANSGIYSTSRMVYGLVQDGDAPKSFGRLSSRKVPRRNPEHAAVRALHEAKVRMEHQEKHTTPVESVSAS